MGLKRVPRQQVSAYGVIDPSGDMDDDGVVAIRTMVEKPEGQRRPERPDHHRPVRAHARRVRRTGARQPGSGGEIQLTDALRAQAANGPFHGVLSTIARYDTGTPLGWLSAVVDIALDDPTIGDEFATFLRSRSADSAELSRVVDQQPCWSTSNSTEPVRRERTPSGESRVARSDGSLARASRVSTSTLTTGSSALSPTCSGRRRIGQ